MFIWERQDPVVALLLTPAQVAMKYRMARVPISQAQLQTHFDDQLDFIGRSCEAYDQGHTAEAKRLAVTLRVLFHDTRSSTSLLRQLDRLDTQFCDTLSPLTGISVVPEMGLIVQHWGPHGVEYKAPLDTVANSRFIDFDDWWSGVICKMPDGETVSRSSLVLTAANQDGGAHVDPALDGLYHSLAHENGLGFVTNNGGVDQPPMGDPTKAALRQIAHETLKSLIDGYGKSFLPTGMMIGGISISSSPPPSIAAIHYQGPDGTKTPADMQCPCGSGAPYKGCHDKS